MGYTKEQKKSIKKWLGGSVFAGALAITTSWLMFNFAWIFRSKGRDSWFWWWMDDERGVEGDWSDDYYSYIIRKGGNPDGKESWWIAWNWHTRNGMWNYKRDKFLVNSTPAEQGNNNIERSEVIIDSLYRLNSDKTITLLNQEGLWEVIAGLKYLPKYPWENIWQVNKGGTISFKTSILGEGMMWFYAAGKNELMFRYSSCNIVEYKIFGIMLWKGWRTIKLGYGGKSYVMTVKHQPIKPWG